MTLVLVDKMQPLNSEPIFHSAFNQFGKFQPFPLKDSKIFWSTKYQCSQTHKHPFMSLDVIAVKSSLKLACVPFTRNLYILGNICGFCVKMAEITLSMNEVLFECHDC